MNIRKSILLRVRIAFLTVFLFAAGIVAKIINIQWSEGAQWKQIAKNISLQYRDIPAARGNIYSDNGSLLATSLPFYKVAFDPMVCNEEAYRQGVDSLAYLLANFYKDKSTTQYKQLIHDARLAGKEYVILNRQEINYQDKKVMSRWPIFRLGRQRGGIIFETVNKRFKPFASLAFRTIGSINQEERGTTGLEYSFNAELAGQSGKALFKKIAGNDWKPVHNDVEISPEQGLDIITTLNVNLQDVAATALLKALREHDADYGAVVVMEVQTGEIKAMVNLSKNKSGRYVERYNYAVGKAGVTEPGSTFKLASILALFEETSLKITDKVETGDGKYRFYDKIMKDHKPGGYGTITIEEAFAKSSNIAIAKLTEEHFGLKPQRFLDYINQFGLSQPLGFQMKGEGVPYIKNTQDKSWSGITLPWMAYGYELKLTPLQTLTFYNAIANNGKLIRPIIVKEIRKANQPIKTFDATVLDSKICSQRSIEKAKKLLEAVVEEGTASNIKGTHYKIAGKTGTAQKFIDGRYTRRYYTSFAGYFPAKNPKYSCIVVIDDPKGYKQYGSDVAAPVFKEIADKIYAKDINLHAVFAEKKQKSIFPVIKSGYAEELLLISTALDIPHANASAQGWVTTTLKNDKIYWKNNPIEHDKVPYVVGMTFRDALPILENQGLRVDFNGSGRVVKQSIPSGSKVIKGSQILLTLE